MSKKYAESSNYKKRYPHHLPWAKAMWIIKRGDILENPSDSKRYRVIEYNLPPIEGAIPKIAVEEVDVKED